MGAWIEIITDNHKLIYAFLVAPHVGAWIEIRNQDVSISVGAVAPHVGAWIEIQDPCPKITPAVVAPHVGAWIEII